MRTRLAPQRGIRIGNVSGATGDAPHAMLRMAQTGDVDFITGDWLSEMNIAWNAIAKASDPSQGYEVGFLSQLEESIDIIVEKKIKVVTNAGALNTEGLREKVRELCTKKRYGHLRIAAVLGDDVTAEVVEMIGAAAWWHDWKQDSFDELAGALVAGHLIECGPYVCGAKFSGFKDLLPGLVDVGFPIAEVMRNGSSYITKQEDLGGKVTAANVTAQLLYELQGEMYLNPDVVADIRTVHITPTAEPRREVLVSGVKGYPPPLTTKVMVAAPGGYQAETIYYLNGLDISEKAEMMKRQLTSIFQGHRFSKLSMELYGGQALDPKSQAAGTAMLRVFVQAKRKEDIAASNFRIPIYSLRMQSYPGKLSHELGLPLNGSQAFHGDFPTTIPISQINHRMRLDNEPIIYAPSPPMFAEYPQLRPSYETATALDLRSFGLSSKAPLGAIVHARSGDKGNNSNVGFFVRYADEYPWLQSFLTVERLCVLFEDDWKDGYKAERCEFPNILAIHFRVLDFLDGGIASSSRIDGLGKGIGEYLRSKVVDIPIRFLQRGYI
ncbi:uncharacterized protein ALTATR162_LOCUS11101 [Alternaria atra]|uniref:DUF1446-domain-containing protein n=1 Tax=Alternaria atra TaxID=119953 RepID=A0A8J2IAN3_9PLEO|nr:uncharacterized protein ALTATR162_LOCUS11101 [Alternaria atra]CAG5184826.1 unnamed protein product [Alternaria atra]